jgi:hypothetical protein
MSGLGGGTDMPFKQDHSGLGPEADLLQIVCPPTEAPVEISCYSVVSGTIVAP